MTTSSPISTPRTVITRSAMTTRSLQAQQQIACFHLHALANEHLGDLAVKLGINRRLHLHRLHRHELMPRFHVFAWHDIDARQILSAYAGRWAIECTFENGKQYLGFEDAANRVRLAVKRTAPLALFLYSMMVVWFHQVGHALVQFPDRPWYSRKKEPSFGDILSTLRRVSYEEHSALLTEKQTPDKTWLTRVIELLSRTG